MTVNNLDVSGLVRRLRKFQQEVVKSASSSVNAVSAADFARAKSYLAASVKYIDWIVAQPQLDLPETSPTDIELGAQIPLLPLENDALQDLANLYAALENELVNSQSARLSTGLISHDEIRARAIIAKMDKFLDDYVNTILPLDLPESSPSTANTGAGKKGV